MRNGSDSTSYMPWIALLIMLGAMLVGLSLN
jgi:hypothetical protein